MITIDISNGHDPQPDKPSRLGTGLIRMIKLLSHKMGLPGDIAKGKSGLPSEMKHKLIK